MTLRFYHVTLLLLAASLSAQDYDLVIRAGRVMDPATKLDGVRDVGIRAGKIAAISASALPGKQVLDAAGLVVAPGFIDLHAHGQDRANNELQARDGVTTALELEIGTADVGAWYAAREGKSLLNYGVSVGHVPVRMQVLHDSGAGMMPTGDAAHRAATDAEILECERLMERGFEQGAIAAGFGLQYVPAATRWEVLRMFQVAAKHHASCHVHMRYAGDREPLSSMTALEEVLAASAITGAPLHVVHITSTALNLTGHALSAIGMARSKGLDVTTECYPYGAGMTYIQSSVFDEGWRETQHIDYKDLQWAATGERLNADSFARYRKQGGLVAVHSIPSDVVRMAVGNPMTLIASDGIMTEGKGHPRTAGCFSRVLGQYVREEKVLSLMDALDKMTRRPAERVPALRNKGKIAVGADADITVFDAATIRDRATYERPTIPSEGIRFVLVNGNLVVKDGKLVEGVSPGREVRGGL